MKSGIEWESGRGCSVPRLRERFSVMSRAVQILMAVVSLAVPAYSLAQESSELVDAARAGDADLVRKLLDDGADVEETHRAITPLMASAGHGHFEVTEILLDADADVNRGSNNGYPALTFAAFGGHSEIVALLLDHRAHVKARSATGVTPLLAGATVSEPETVRLLLEKGADVHAADVQGRTPLMFAAASGNLQTVDMLIAAGAELDAQSSDGYTAVSLATIYQREEILKALGGGPPSDAASFPNAARMKDDSVTDAPKLEKQVHPTYTDDALYRRREGEVLLEVVITKEGRISAVRVLSSLDIGLDLSAIACVRQWQFTPGKRDGVAIDILAEIEVAFSIF